MPKITYIDKNFQRSSLEVISRAEIILDEYAVQGFTLTLRQLYYQFVARDLIPNNERSYKRLGSIISDGRLAGMLDWYHLEDRTRGLAGNSHWSSPASIIRSAARGYAIDKWEPQDCRVEVWVEKDALVGIVGIACSPLDIDYFSCRGYTSQSEMWRAGRRLKRYIDDGQRPVVLHLGDHDPSGIDMSRDIADRLSLFITGDEHYDSYGTTVFDFERIALTMDQIEELSPPPNPAKTTDSRFAEYITKYGNESWELDALEPSYIRNLIETHVLEYRDEDKWDEAVESEEQDRKRLMEIADQFDNGD